jgi:Protein of unknown function (DUF3631)
MTVAEILAKNSIALESTESGQYYAICPQCSHKRSTPTHRAEKKLGVLIDDRGVCWHCNHCEWTGPEKGGGEPRGNGRELVSHIYRNADGTVQFRKVRNLPGRNPKCWFERPDGNGGWINSKKAPKDWPKLDTQILYRADEIKKAIAENRIIACAEGEKDCDNLWALGIAATCNAHGASDPELNQRPKWKTTHSEQLKGADLVVFNNNDPAGYAHADITCKLSHGLAKSVRRLDLAPHWPDMPKGADVSDWLALGHTRDELVALINAAPDYQPVDNSGNNPNPIDDNAELEKLARMSLIDYGRARKEAAKKLGISQVSLLDALVKAKRAELGLDGGDDKQGRAISFSEIEPWPEPVTGSTLLDEIDNAIGSHVIMAEHSRVACVLWVMHTYLLQYFQVTPRLAVHSPVRRCGKTTLLDVLACLVQRPKLAASVTAATVLRVVEKHHPTLLIDEAEAALTDNEELRKVIDSGHRRNGTGMRSVGDDHETREFSTYTPVAIALIGKRLPPTTTDRSIVVDLQRRKQSEKITRFRIGRTPHLDVLARKIVRWIADNGERAGSIEPQMPDKLFNRQADNWEPLLMVADAIGGHWPARGRAASTTAGEKIEEGERLEMLLSDIRDIFAKRKENKVERADEIPSGTLAEGLAAIEGRPWAEYGRGGKPITPNKLAKLLKLAEVAPDYIGPKTDRCRGYTLEQFKDAFERMLAPEKEVSKCAPCAPPYKTGTSSTFQSVHPEPGAHSEKSQKPPENGRVHRVHTSESLFQGEGLSRATRKQLVDLARAHADSLRQGAAALDLDTVETFVRERIKAAIGDPDQVEPEVATIMGMLFQ